MPFVLDNSLPPKNLQSRMRDWIKSHPFKTAGLFMLMVVLAAVFIGVALLWPLQNVGFTITSVRILDSCEVPLRYSIGVRVSNPASLSVDLRDVNIVIKSSNRIIARSIVDHLSVKSGVHLVEINGSLDILNNKELAGPLPPPFSQLL